jgi:hypothetical protein
LSSSLWRRSSSCSPPPTRKLDPDTEVFLELHQAHREEIRIAEDIAEQAEVLQETIRDYRQNCVRLLLTHWRTYP